MTRTMEFQEEVRHERYGLKVAAWLNEGTQGLPSDVRERLRAARVQAVDRRKMPEPVQVPVVLRMGGTAMLGGGPGVSGWWPRLVAVLPLLALVAGLVVIHRVQNDKTVRELAEIDAALLLDELPPAAYADPGFAQFLKTSVSESR